MAPTGNGYTIAMQQKLMQYERKTHRELLAEARRPVESITPEHIDYLREEMVRQNRFTFGTNNFKTRWANEEGEE